MSINQKIFIFGKKLFLAILIRKPKYIAVPSFKPISSKTEKLTFLWTTTTTTTEFQHLYRASLRTLDKKSGILEWSKFTWRRAMPHD